MGKREHTGAVKVAKFKVIGVDGLDKNGFKESKKRWLRQADEVKQVSNLILQTWLHWHIENDSANKLRGWLDKRKELKDKKIRVNKAGACPVVAVSKELSKIIYDKTRELFPHIHTRTLSLLQSRVLSTLKAKKAAKGSLPGWSSILLCNESLPTYSHTQPIPFNNKNSKLIEKSGRLSIEVRTQLEKPGKGFSEELKLFSNGRRVRSQVQIFKKILSGEFKFKGSNLRYNQGDNTWYVEICHQTPVHRREDIDKGKVAYLVPGRDVPFKLVIPGRKRHVWLQHRGHHIESQRKRVFNARRSHGRNYRNATTRKGKGYQHANRWRDKYSRMWQNFVKRVNHNTSQKAVSECLERGIGKLVYCKPGGVVSENRVVSKLGSTGRDQSTWEFFQLKTMLEYKCQRVGIEFSTVEFDGSKSVKSSSDK